MITRALKNIIIVIIIICSTSLFKFKFLRNYQTIAELAGIAIIVAFLLLYLIYTDHPRVKKHFIFPIILILLSFTTSVLMASYIHNQKVMNTMIVQYSFGYYLFYFLLHHLKVEVRDLERMFFAFGILHVIFYLVQYFIYPTIIFDGYVMKMRGTVRIYLMGADYFVIAMFISMQRFFRTNRPIYLIFLLVFFSMFILMGGRQMLAIMVFVIALFLFFDRKVKSRLMLGFLSLAGAVALFYMFQPVIETLFLKTAEDVKLAEDYIRIQAANFFLGDFYEHPLAYITGNGEPHNSRYAYQMSIYNSRGFYLSDLGLIGNYVLYGIFFIIGVIIICVKMLKIKIELQYIYIRYMFIAIVLSLVMGAGFAKADTICAIIFLLYIADKSNHSLLRQKLSTNVHLKQE